MNFKTTVLLILNSSFVGVAYIFTKGGLKLFQPMQLLGFRFTMSLLFMVILILFGVIKIDLKIKFKKILLLQIILSPLLYFTLETTGLKYIDSSYASIILSISPIVATILGSIFLNEKMNAKQILFILIAFAAICVLNIYKSVDGKSFNPIGFIIILMAAVCSGMTNIATKKTLKEYSSFTLLFISMLVGSIFFTTAGIFEGISAGTIGSYFLPLTKVDGIITILYLSTMPGVVYSIIYYYCIKRVKVSTVSVFSYLMPIVSIIAAAAILKENVSIVDIACVLVIILGMAFSVLVSKNKKDKISLEV